VVPGEQHDELVLRLVRVLVLVDQDVAEALLVGGAHVLAALQHLDGDEEEVVEVHGVGREQPPLVLGVDLGDASTERVGATGRCVGEGGGIDQLRLGLADHRGDLARRQPLGVEPISATMSSIRRRESVSS